MNYSEVSAFKVHSLMNNIPNDSNVPKKKRKKRRNKLKQQQLKNNIDENKSECLEPKILMTLQEKDVSNIKHLEGSKKKRKRKNIALIDEVSSYGKVSPQHKKQKCLTNVVESVNLSVTKCTRDVDKKKQKKKGVNYGTIDNDEREQIFDKSGSKRKNKKIIENNKSLCDNLSDERRNNLNNISIDSVTEDRYAEKMSSHNDTDTLLSHCLKTSNFHPNFSLMDSYVKGKKLFEWILSPLQIDLFMTNNWEKEPLFIQRDCSDYYSILMNTQDIDRILRNNDLNYTDNIDVTIYTNNKRQTFNPVGRAHPHVVWDFYNNDCSIRLPNPHLFLDKIFAVNATLQEYFGCFVGANIYLTPPKSQGFAPHYDDIEAFILQIEGKKHWKIYKPLSENDVLPRYSSKNFSSNEIGEPVLEVELKAGDMLYFPRGYIHQGYTDNNEHSLHLTLSVYQCNAWIDLLEKVIPKALEKAWKTDVDYRKGLPLEYLKSAGFARCAESNGTRSALINNVATLINRLTDYVDIDSAVDDLGIQFAHSALPPAFTNEEKCCSQWEDGLRMKTNGVVVNYGRLVANTKIRLIRGYAVRFSKCVIEGSHNSEYRLYHTIDNSKKYQAEEVRFLIVPKPFVKCMQYLISSYPKFVAINKLPHDDMTAKLQFLDDLWEDGILMTSKPLKQ